MSELRQCFGQDWVHTFQNELSSDTLCSVLNQTRNGVADPAELRKVLQRELGWGKIASETLAFYEEVITTARDRLR
ncbi:MAG: glycosyl transferase group 1 [Sporomusa sp.]|nr:glycosyl transferase group 1 [Sporomusa sp.]